MQRSFDDLGTPLAQVTFCVLDLETTGASPADCKITEVGAIKLRGGECRGTFETLVNPQTEIPFFITVLTGITQSMVVPAPTIAEILPNLLEFVRDTVIVGHNIRFDISFLNAALAAEGYPRLGNQSVDTCALARRLVRDEVPDCRLSTLSERMRLPHQPCHRAMADTLATADLLHALLERAGTIGVLGLDDLFELPTIRAHPQVGKLKLTAKLPRAPGVYLFRGLGGRVLYVGKATNLRARVRSYFGGDERRKISQLLRETETIDHIVCSGPLEAAVLEVRLIHRHLPPFNHRSKLWSRYAYLKLTLNERFPRLSVVRTPKAGDGCLYLGPLPSTGAARQVAEAIESAVPLRRCSARPPGPAAGAGTAQRPTMCTAAQLGVSVCPCAGGVSEADYAVLVQRVLRGLTVDPTTLLAPLEERMRDLAAAERFEEAADVRDRASALARALARHRRLDSLRRAGRIELDVDGARVVLAGGRLSPSGPLALFDADNVTGGATGPEPAVDPGGPLPRHLVDEVSCVAAWLDAEGRSARLVSCEGPWSSPLPVLPRYEPGRRR
ncbi:MAG: polymerase subunit epsilon [Actinomycetota bacterium]|jgi:DNA polymerase-3 subunit epsilon|nr:polymerase subunit epsilon [Actinomycetota bacterium]